MPILPGIMPVQTYGGFKRMTEFCKTYVPPEITAALEPIKDNDEAVRNYGVELGAQMCRRILASGVQGAPPSPAAAPNPQCPVRWCALRGKTPCGRHLSSPPRHSPVHSPGLHMYSLNQEKAVFAILERVGMINFTHVPRAMPWCAEQPFKDGREEPELDASVMVCRPCCVPGMMKERRSRA